MKRWRITNIFQYYRFFYWISRAEAVGVRKPAHTQYELCCSVPWVRFNENWNDDKTCFKFHFIFKRSHALALSLGCLRATNLLDRDIKESFVVLFVVVAIICHTITNSVRVQNDNVSFIRWLFCCCCCHWCSFPAACGSLRLNYAIFNNNLRHLIDVYY